MIFLYFKSAFYVQFFCSSFSKKSSISPYVLYLFFSLFCFLFVVIFRLIQLYLTGQPGGCGATPFLSLAERGGAYEYIRRVHGYIDHWSFNRCNSEFAPKIVKPPCLGRTGGFTLKLLFAGAGSSRLLVGCLVKYIIANVPEKSISKSPRFRGHGCMIQPSSHLNCIIAADF